jgi:hypothetical protein
MAQQMTYQLPIYEVAKLRKEEEEKAVSYLQYRAFI